MNNQQQKQAISIGEKIIHQFVQEMQSQIESFDQTTQLFIELAFDKICPRINQQCQFLIQQAKDAKNENQQLQNLLQKVRSQYELLLDENQQMKNQLEQLISEAKLREMECYKQIQSSKCELESSKHNILQYEIYQEHVQKKLWSYENKIKEIEQQKLFYIQNSQKHQSRVKQMEQQLRQTQQNLQRLSQSLLFLERSHGQLSQSIELKDNQIKSLNKIIEESQYMSSLSPFSQKKVESQHSEGGSSLFNSQRLGNALEDITVRLSHSQLPMQKSQQESISRQIKVEKNEKKLIPEKKSLANQIKQVYSSQKKPQIKDSLQKQVQRTKTIGLSKKQSHTIKSKLSSIFKDRLQIKSETEDRHQVKVAILQQQIRSLNIQINELKSKIQFVKTVKAQPVIISNNSREVKNTIWKLRSQLQSLQRLMRQTMMRKSFVERDLQQYKQKCSFYKSQHRKLFEKFLLKNAQSAAYSEQLSQLEAEYSKSRDETERREDKIGMVLQESIKERDQFEDLSLKFNNIRNHNYAGQNEQPSFKSGQQQQKNNFYTVQNIYLIENSALDFTLQNERGFQIIKANESIEQSPAKAVLHENSNEDDFILPGIEQIKARDNGNIGEAWTERLLLSQLTRRSRKQNSMSQQVLVDEESKGCLKITNLGCLAEYRPDIINAIKIFDPEQGQSIKNVTLDNRPFKFIETAQIGTSMRIETMQFGVNSVNQTSQIGTSLYIETAQSGTYKYLQTKDVGVTMVNQKVYESIQIEASFSIETASFGVNNVSQTAQIGIFKCMETSQKGTLFNIETVEFGVNCKNQTVQAGTFKLIEAVQIGTSFQVDTIDFGVNNVSETVCIGTNVKIETIDFGVNNINQTAQIGTLIEHRCFFQKSKQIDYKIWCQKKNNFTINSMESIYLITNSQIQSSKPKLSFKKQANTTHKKTQSYGEFDFSSKVSANYIQKNQFRIQKQKKQVFAKAKDILISKAQTYNQKLEQKHYNPFNNFEKIPKKSDLNKTNGRQLIRQFKHEDSYSKNTLKKCQKEKDKSIFFAPTIKKLYNQVNSRIESTLENTQKNQNIQKNIRQFDDSSKQIGELNSKQLSIIRDYFYTLQKFEISRTVDSNSKNIVNYDLNENMYAFHAAKHGRMEKFLIWRGRVIHFGRKTQFMELMDFNRNCKIFRGKDVILGNSQFRIFDDKLQINRIQKRKFFKGEMENGEWSIKKVEIFKAN